ncbi:hypothetical protein MTY59_19650 [Mycobacterium senriense]|uniref:Uncharacterized protein n=1 Tax=Mycobacterium senriense TaxID=2775496 RepID=A0ABN6IFP2_9MYCO|nr:hypothetical protein MTY59_19650 [Mycobacterium senriense]
MLQVASQRIDRIGSDPLEDAGSRQYLFHAAPFNAFRTALRALGAAPEWGRLGSRSRPYTRVRFRNVAGRARRLSVE